jgi:hypothetical protein
MHELPVKIMRYFKEMKGYQVLKDEDTGLSPDKRFLPIYSNSPVYVKVTSKAL